MYQAQQRSVAFHMAFSSSIASFFRSPASSRITNGWSMLRR